ncbi:MAG: flagellin lysine-N-methylase [Clostridia bacterium]|nr:flagellin lysine-N-methylase [Clostridia bacterium]
MEIRPDYYDNFKCIAERCQHNCCIGWEIDIDDDTLKKYNTQTGEIGAKLQKSIALEPCAHFILGNDERCPFLNDKNLCELILVGGEEMLCQICKDHPRFYNDLYGITEKGIGLSCEAAAEIILTKTAPTTFVCDMGAMPQNDFYKRRSEIFAILQDRNLPLTKRIKNLLASENLSLDLGRVNWWSTYKNLERLDDKWDEYLDNTTQISDLIPTALETPCEQLICYFIYRHLSGALYDDMFSERLQFALLSCYVIVSVCKTKTLKELVDIARMYSSEIEYSDENIEILLQKLLEYNS